MNTKLNQQNFFKDVYEVVKLIPSGRVTSYGAIARYLGRAGSARMVGWALNAATALPHVPAHRVLNRLGLLSGKAHFNSPDAMQKRLEAEGHQIINDQIKGFKQAFWDPNEELA